VNCTPHFFCTFPLWTSADQLENKTPRENFPRDLRDGYIPESLAKLSKAASAVHITFFESRSELYTPLLLHVPLMDIG
jgi:hypothetical protein